ncbi:MAG: hypothetical protein AB1744_07600 [Candidatus Zixiibacteriota bacterium]
MLNRFTLPTMVLLLGLVALIPVSCSSEKSPKGKAGLVDEVIDSVAATVVAGFSEASEAKATTALEKSAPRETGNFVFQVTDMLLVEPKLYAVYDGGVIVYDFDQKSQSLIPADERLTSLALHEGNIYVGGAKLYTVSEPALEPVEYNVVDTITSLYSYNYRLMIGTRSGLYSKSIFGPQELFQDAPITAMVADENGLWVGTAGQGLYRWDGEEFHKRFLLRDTSLFDSVNCLDFKHHHVYVGTTNGLHIFNGGRWENLSTGEGLPSNNVTAIDASQWVVYVGTDNGVVTYFNGEIAPVDKLEDRAVSNIRVRGRQLIAGTDYDGILLKSRRALKTLVQPVVDSSLNILSLIQ